MTVNQGGVIQKIKLKCNTTIGTIVAVMIRMSQDEAIKKILVLLGAYLLIIVGLYLFAFGQSITHPNTQSFGNLSTLLILYFIVAGILLVVMFFYTRSKKPIKSDTDGENLEKLKLSINEKIDESINKGRRSQ